ncbi:MAG: thioesterase family protein [Myxococcota bacterium]
MNLYLRMLWVLAAAARAPRIEPLGASRIRLPVLPGDLDAHGHVNNGRTMTLLDLGRLDLTVRTGLWRGVYGDGLQPMVASAMVRFRRELRLGQVVDVTTRVMGWDDEWLYLEHRLTREGKLATAAIIKAAVLGKEGRLPPRALTERFGVDLASPPLPDSIVAWQGAEQALFSSGAA